MAVVACVGEKKSRRELDASNKPVRSLHYSLRARANNAPRHGEQANERANHRGSGRGVYRRSIEGIRNSVTVISGGGKVVSVRSSKQAARRRRGGLRQRPRPSERELTG